MIKLFICNVVIKLTDENVINRERSLEEIKDNYDKIVVSMDYIKYPSKEGIEMCRHGSKM